MARRATVSRARFCSIPAAESSAAGRRGSSPGSMPAGISASSRSRMGRPAPCFRPCPNRRAASAGGSCFGTERRSLATAVAPSRSFGRCERPACSAGSSKRFECLPSSTCWTCSWRGTAATSVGSFPTDRRRGAIPDAARLIRQRLCVERSDTGRDDGSHRDLRLRSQREGAYGRSVIRIRRTREDE
jgi:hypothetical protein